METTTQTDNREASANHKKNPKKPIPIFEIHGTNDKITLFQGDIENKEGWGPYYGLPETIQFWVDKHNLDKSEYIQISSILTHM